MIIKCKQRWLSFNHLQKKKKTQNLINKNQKYEEKKRASYCTLVLLFFITSSSSITVQKQLQAKTNLTKGFVIDNYKFTKSTPQSFVELHIHPDPLLPYLQLSILRTGWAAVEANRCTTCGASRHFYQPFIDAIRMEDVIAVRKASAPLTFLQRLQTHHAFSRRFCSHAIEPESRKIL